MQSATHFKRFSTHPACRIVVDSCSDITEALAAELGVDIIEFPFVMEDGEHWDDQWASLTPSGFYGRMRAGERVQTSSIPTGQFLQIFESFARDGIPTLYLSLTAGLSSSVRDAERAAKTVMEAHPGFQMVAMDNCMPALTALLLVEGAVRKRDEGMPMAELAAWCEENARFVHGYFTLESLDRLVAGGRVPKAAASVTAVLDMKANLTYDLDGALTLTGMSRGRKKALKNLVKEFKENYVPSDRMIGIVHADDPEAAATVEQMVREELGAACPRIQTLVLDPTIGAHVGPGMIALAFWGVDRSASSKRGKR